MSKERFYPRKPPHPLRILSKPYLDKYEPQTFAQYEGRKGNAIEHMSKFIDTLGPYATDEDLCLWEFSKFQCDQAYTWYTSLKPGSIPTWDDMVEVFCSKYFQWEESITLATLQGTKQRRPHGIHQKVQRHSSWLLWPLRGNNIGKDVHGKYDYGILGCQWKLWDFSIHSTTAKG